MLNDVHGSDGLVAGHWLTNPDNPNLNPCRYFKMELSAYLSQVGKTRTGLMLTIGYVSF